ncbi:hypothetical protein [Pseudonocardia sp. T1-2H]|uniref:hypothetical protein n=1 Tax=Pseudonocardia sp. T1-2H TaxID=3128899 RepID=UPI0031018BEF
MGATPSDSEILAALDRSGFLLEQRVAAELEAAGFGVRISAAYMDPDLQKTREIDIIAARRVTDRGGHKRHAWLIITVECKSTPLPHIAFLNDWKNWDRENLPWEVRLPPEFETLKRFTDEWAIHRVNSTRRAVQVVRMDREGSGFKARSDMHETGLPAIKAARDARIRYGGADRTTPIISFPVAVVGGDILSVGPGDYDNPTLTHQDFVVVSYENRSEWTSRDHNRSHYDLVSFTSMRKWIDHINSVSGRVAEYVPHLPPSLDFDD